MFQYKTTNFDKEAFRKSETGGLKDAAGKPDISIMPPNSVEGISAALEFGANKYGRYNYLNGLDWTDVASAALRHIFKWLRGEDTDQESGLHHLFHAGACVCMLIAFVTTKKGRDNRYKGE